MSVLVFHDEYFLKEKDIKIMLEKRMIKLIATNIDAIIMSNMKVGTSTSTTESSVSANDTLYILYSWGSYYVTIKYNITVDVRTNKRIFNLYILDISSKIQRLGIGSKIIQILKGFTGLLFDTIYVHTVCNSTLYNMLENNDFSVYNSFSKVTRSTLLQMLEMDLDVFDMVYPGD